MRHLFADRLQDVQDALKHVFIPADHHAQLATAGVMGVAQHAGIQRGVTRLCRPVVELAWKVRRDRTHVDDATAFGQGGKDTLVSEQHGADDVLIGQAEHYHFGVPGDVLGRVGDSGAQLLGRGTLLARAIVHGDGKARLSQTASHSQAHAAQPDKTDSLLCH